MGGVRINWTEEMDNQLRELFPTTDNRSLACILGVSVAAMKERAYKHYGLRKTVIADRGPEVFRRGIIDFDLYAWRQGYELNGN